MGILYRMGYAVRHPVRVWDRITWDARANAFSPARGRARLFRLLERRFGANPQRLLDEYRGSNFLREFEERMGALAGLDRIRSGTSAGFDCEALYLLLRAARPSVMVETGVLYGASSAHILEAMRANGSGTLYSLDLPSEPGEPSHQFLIPDDLTAGWNLVLGDIRETLPDLLGRLGSIDQFHHDSSHDFAHMTWEYETAWEHIARPGIFSSHNVIVPLLRKSAFRAYCRRRQIRPEIFRNLGIVTLDPASS